MNKKGEFRIGTFLIMTVVFVAMVTAISTGVADYIFKSEQNNFDAVIDSDSLSQSESFDKFAEITERTYLIQSQVQSATPEQGEEILYVKAGFATLKTVGESVSTVTEVTTDAERIMPVDKSLTNMWITIVILSVSLVILGIIFRVVLV